MSWVEHNDDYVRLVSFLKPKGLIHIQPVRFLQLESPVIAGCAQIFFLIADCDSLLLVHHR
jgi:hypothetical protein